MYSKTLLCSENHVLAMSTVDDFTWTIGPGCGVEIHGHPSLEP